jgi:8-oxo-dGTP diphosphatase
VKRLTLADLINEAEISELMADYGPGQRRQVTLEVSARSFENWLGKMVHHPNRRGEAVLVIQRPDGHVLLHTKRFYPEAIFRLPSGGVHPDEAVLAGVMREAKEETGLDVTLDRFLGTVEYQFRNGQRQLPFVSYLFVLQADNSTPVVHDPGEEITGFRYVSPASLRQVADQLRSLPPQWTDWGNFRALPHDIVADALRA